MASGRQKLHLLHLKGVFALSKYFFSSAFTSVDCMQSTLLNTLDIFFFLGRRCNRSNRCNTWRQNKENLGYTSKGEV